MTCSRTRASECCGMKLAPSISRRSRVISSTMEALFMNHQQPKGMRLLNFREKTVGRKIAAKIFEGAEIGSADGVACETDSRIDLLANADHQGERQTQFAASGKHGVAQ